MPAVMEQINRMSVSDKMRIMEYLLKSIARSVERASAGAAPQRGDFSRFAGRWTLDEANVFAQATARSIDDGDWQ